MKTGIFYWGIVILLLICAVPVYGAGSFESYLVARSDSLKYNSIASDNGNVSWVEYSSGLDSQNDSRTIYRYSIADRKKRTGYPGYLMEAGSRRYQGTRYVWSDGRGIFLYDDAKNRLTFLLLR